MGVLDQYRGIDPLIRTYTAAQWAAANYVLLDGELGIESDTGKQKAGDGRKWADTPYFTPTGATISFVVFDPDVNENRTLVFENGILISAETV